jgi:hypothetical protein
MPSRLPAASDLLTVVVPRSGVLSPFGRFFQFPGEFLNPLAHDLSGLKLHRSSRWNDEATARLVWVSPHARLRKPRLKNTEVTQLDSHIIGQAIGNFIKRPLHYIEDFVLNHSCLVTDRDDDVAFGEFCHIHKKNRPSLPNWRQKKENFAAKLFGKKKQTRPANAN